MNIQYLMWHDITITRLDKSNKRDVVECGTLRFEKMKFDMKPGTEVIPRLHITGYDSVQGCSNSKQHSYMRPELIKLNSQEIELLAEGWSGNKKFKVSITAKF